MHPMKNISSLQDLPLSVKLSVIVSVIPLRAIYALLKDSTYIMFIYIIQVFERPLVSP